MPEITSHPLSHSYILYLGNVNDAHDYLHKTTSLSCTVAGSLRFQLCNLSHPFCQSPTDSVFQSVIIFHGLYKQFASITDKGVRGTKSRSNCSNVL